MSSTIKYLRGKEPKRLSMISRCKKSTEWKRNKFKNYQNLSYSIKLKDKLQKKIMQIRFNYNRLDSVSWERPKRLRTKSLTKSSKQSKTHT